MKKSEGIVTAANSRTMNAVEKPARFAEAAIQGSTPDFTSKEELPNTVGSKQQTDNRDRKKTLKKRP